MFWVSGSGCLLVAFIRDWFWDLWSWLSPLINWGMEWTFIKILNDIKLLGVEATGGGCNQGWQSEIGACLGYVWICLITYYLLEGHRGDEAMLFPLKGLEAMEPSSSNGNSNETWQNFFLVTVIKHWLWLPKGCEISIFGDTQNLTRQCPGQTWPSFEAGLALSKEVNYMTFIDS